MAASTLAAPLPADPRCKACSAHVCSNAYSWYIDPYDLYGQKCICSCCGRCTPNGAYSPRPLYCDTWSLDSGSTVSTGSSHGEYYAPAPPASYSPYELYYDPIGSPNTAPPEPPYAYTPLVWSPATATAAAAAPATAPCKSTCRTFCAATYDCKKCSGSTTHAAPCSKGCAKCKAGK